MKLLKSEQGFSLVELMVGMTLMLIVLGAVAVITSNSFRIDSNNIRKGNNLQDATNALNRIGEELQYAYADTLVIPQDGKFLPQNSVKYPTIVGFDLPIETPEIYFVRGLENSDAYQNREERHIVLRNHSLVMEYAPSPQNSKPWPAANIKKTVTLIANNVQNFDIKLEDTNVDGDIADQRQRRKKVTITIVMSGRTKTETLTSQVMINNL
ncbi:MAG: prepilin-type N-terminal cleavage/methylation domain-containing protein [Pelosinus sp.]|nr:prepilin-type N-terminal cleavage/methylation domain-containing protein [Pelosinus sp.]